MTKINSMTRLRFQQIRLLAKTIERFSSFNRPSRLLSALGSSSLIDHSLTGFRRIFPTFEDARRHASRYRVPSHEHPGNITTHTFRTEEIRPSDYPVLFHMERLKGEIKSVLDIGGSVGNLFYCYSRFLTYPPEMTWTVFEVPEAIKAGWRIAKERNESRLRFVERIKDCAAVDTVVISGALHYFEELPPQLFGELDRQPRHVFINRTPVIEGPTVITIQDHEEYFALSPARILSRDTLMRAMTEAGYELIDAWKANELRLRIPLHPEASVSAYSGFYFRLRRETCTPVLRESKALVGAI